MSKSTSTATDKIANSLWVIVALLVFFVLIFFSDKFKNIIEPNAITTMAWDKSCDLRRGECTSVLEDGRKVSLSISPSNIPLLVPLSFHVKTEGFDASNVEVDIIGIGMDMGFNRTTLLTNDKTSYSGKVILPICSRSRMEWEARILLKTPKGIVSTPFRFFTDK